MRTAKNSQKNAATQPVPQVKKLPTPKVPAKNEQPAKVSLEDRIQKVEELRSLTGKRQRTIETLHQLRAFHFASDENCTLSIIDGQGHKFITSNTNLITLLKDHVITLLDDKVSTLDEEIVSFSL